MSTEPPTEPLPPVAPPPPDPAPEPAREGLYRSDQDRMIFGVCGGISERYALDAPVVRLLFLATLLLGGAGFLFYIAAAILIPARPTGSDGITGPTTSPATGALNGALRLIVTLSLAFALFVAALTVGAVSFATTAVFGAWPVAVALLLTAGLLVLGGLGGRVNRALLVIVLALALPAAGALVGDVRVDRSVGERRVHPTTIADATAGARLGVGYLRLDLRDLPLRDGQHVTIPASVDVGRLDVLLPDDRCVAWTVRTRQTVGGEAIVLGRTATTNWWGDEQRYATQIDPGRQGKRPQVTLELRTGAGVIAVGRSRAELNLEAVDRDRDARERPVRTPACDQPRDGQRAG